MGAAELARNAHDCGWNAHRIAHIRKRLLQVLKELRDQKNEEKRLGERDAKRWTLTIAFVPAEHARG